MLGLLGLPLSVLFYRKAAAVERRIRSWPPADPLAVGALAGCAGVALLIACYSAWSLLSGSW